MRLPPIEAGGAAPAAAPDAPTPPAEAPAEALDDALAAAPPQAQRSTEAKAPPPGPAKSVVGDRTFWEVYGFMGLALVVSFTLGSAILLWLAINGFRCYSYSAGLDAGDKVAKTFALAGYDLSPAVDITDPDEYRKDYIVNSGLETSANMRISDYDYLYSDNYKYTRWKNTYTLDSIEVVIGSVATLALALAYIAQVWEMTVGWRGFLQKSCDVQTSTGASTAKVAPGQPPPVNAYAMASGARGTSGVARASAAAAGRASRFGTINKKIVERFIDADARIGGKDDMIEIGALLLSIALSFSSFWGAWWLIGVGVVIMIVVAVTFVLCKDSNIGATIFFELLETSGQAYQLLVWSGTDVLLYLTMSAMDYQEAQLSFTVVGDGGAAVVVLTWLVTLNLVFSPLLFLYDQAYTINHTLLDLAVETAYGVWAMIVAVQQAQFQQLPAPVLVPSTISGFALMLFPWFIMLIHMPRQIRDGLVALIILDKLEKPSKPKIEPEAAAGRRKTRRTEYRNAVLGMMKQEHFTSPQTRFVGASIMAGGLALACYVTAAAVDPTIVSDTCDDPGFSADKLDGFGTDYWMCQTQAYDWRFSRTQGAVQDDAFSAWREQFGGYDMAECRDEVGGICGVNYQYARRALLDGATDTRNAKAFSITRGCLCLQPTPYTMDVDDQTSLPESLLTRYVGIRELIFDGRGLASLPGKIKNLKTLESLSLIGNELTSLPSSLASLRRLWYLALQGNAIAELPADFGDLDTLHYLFLGYNSLTELPSLAKMTKLRELNLVANGLTSLPEDLGSCTALESLELGLNAFTSMPASVSNLVNLKFLSANRGALSEAFPDVSQLRKLKRLDLLFNDLPTAPDGLEALESLEVLRLEGNKQIDSLPAGLASLPNLYFVGVWNTGLCTTGFSINASKLDAAFAPLIADKTITCCMPESALWSSCLEDN